MNLSELAREQARRVDELFVRVAAAHARATCPFPVRVLIEERYPGRVSVHAAGMPLASVTVDDLIGERFVDSRDPWELGSFLGDRAAAGYLAAPIEPIPDNVILGAE